MRTSIHTDEAYCRQIHCEYWFFFWSPFMPRKRSRSAGGCARRRTQQPDVVRDRDRVLALAAEHQQVVGVGDAAPRRVLAQRLVVQALHHGAVADHQRLLPDHPPPAVGEAPRRSCSADDLARAGRTSRRTPALDSGMSMQWTALIRPGIVSRATSSMHEAVVLEELVAVDAVGQVALVAAVLVQPGERRRVERQVDRPVRQPASPRRSRRSRARSGR
jgi:hypothetical protein